MKLADFLELARVFCTEAPKGFVRVVRCETVSGGSPQETLAADGYYPRHWDELPTARSDKPVSYVDKQRFKKIQDLGIIVYGADGDKFSLWWPEDFLDRALAQHDNLRVAVYQVRAEMAACFSLQIVFVQDQAIRLGQFPESTQPEGVFYVPPFRTY